MIKKHWKVLLLVILLVLAGIYYFNFRSTNQRASQQTIDPGMIMEVERDSLQQTISAEGFIQARDTEDLNFPSSSGSVKVKKIYVSEGDRVEEGQLLMELDETEAELNYIQRENAYKRAQINGSNNEIREAKLNYQLAEDRLENLKLMAPFSGIITDIYLKEGSHYTSGDAATIKDVSRLEVEINIDESDLPTIELGQQVVLTLPSIPDIELTGEVSELGDEADNSNSVVNIPVSVLIEENDYPIRLGVSASLEIITGEISDKVVVPVTAVINNNGQDTVIKVVDGETEEVAVETGLTDGLRIVIESGL
ncbi:MAG: efflux RND transporter periplasmic adaptor subunit [Halanaerobiales bacterium]